MWSICSTKEDSPYACNAGVTPFSPSQSKLRTSLLSSVKWGIKLLYNECSRKREALSKEQTAVQGAGDAEVGMATMV
jgi:hypothetical protein